MPEARIRVRLQPRASRNELLGFRDGTLIARVSAPPSEGRANDALCRLIAERIGIAPSRVTVVRGQRSRLKLVRIEAADEVAVAAALGRGAA